MKQSIRNRILSFVMALLLFVSGVPFSEVHVTSNAVESDAVAQPQTTPQYDHDTLKITLDEKFITSLDILPTEKVFVSADGLTESANYQWQVEHPEKDGVWVNIYDGTEKELGVSLALTENVMRADGTAKLRCRAYTDDCAYLSNAVTVNLLTGSIAPAAPARSESGNTLNLSNSDLEFVTVEIRYIKWEYIQHVDDKGVTTFVLEKTGSAYGSYVATIRTGSNFNVSVPNPVIIGFNPGLVPQAGATISNDTVYISLDNVTENVVFEVEYRPAQVNYSVHYYFQNIYDDLYVENTVLAPSVALKGDTGNMPSLDATQKVVEGFTALFYEPDIIAADGSTMFNVYYERNYYLMEFDCDGGYGTDTIYVRYGTYIAVADPIKSGWVFGGWDLIDTDNANNTETFGDGQYNVLPQTLPAYNSAYKAIWNIAQTTYTVVYWRENANDSRYSYWGFKQVSANSNDHVSATSHSSLTGTSLSETDYFTYNAAMTVAEESKRTDLAADGKVVVEGDGSTVLNVYFSRNVYTLEFSLSGNTFTIPEGGHQHGDGTCTYDVICAFPNHVHGDACVSTLTCTIPLHDAHTAACLSCGYDQEHTHSDACLQCGKEIHTHTAACCTVDVHAHRIACYAPTGTYQDGSAAGNNNGWTAMQGINNPQAGYVYKYRRNSSNYYNFFYDGASWYYLGTGTTYCGLITSMSNPNSNGSYTSAPATKAVTCNKTAHNHTSGCEYCTKPAGHVQNADCCTLTEHAHFIGCYAPTGTYQDGKEGTGWNTIGNISNPQAGYVYKYRNARNDYYNFFYDGTKWYYLGTGTTYCGLITSMSNPNSNGSYTSAPATREMTCGLENHTHDGVNCQYCCLEEHPAHTNSCYCDTREHTHKDSCYKDVIHSHTDACYTWTCGASAHTHTDACYGNCNKAEWYVQGTGSSAKYIIKAKYNQTIGKLWPTATCFPNIKLTQWKIEGVSNPAVSKRVNMTSDLCTNTTGANRTKEVTGTFVTSTNNKQTLYYMFESTNQTDSANGDDRRELNGVFYDIDTDYSQVVNYSSTSWSQKEIAGMTPVSSGVKYESSDTKVFLYYNRSRFDLQFHNVNEVVATYSNQMFGIKLNTIYSDALGYASAYTPPYPDVYEPGAYVFKGWYTTPECFEGTKVDWANMEIPEIDLTLYAKWEPVKRNVYFYLTYEDIALNDTWETKDQYGNDVSYPIVVEHGAVLGTAYHYTPQRLDDYDNDGIQDYTFVGWFYMDEDNKKRFAPDTMEIKKDMYLFAEWQSLVDTEYKVEYVLKDGETVNGVQYPAGTVLAVPVEGHSTAGRTKTFTAKAGNQLLEAFRDAAIFPLTNTHSILMDANPTENTYIFEYVLDPEVYYKVRYVNKVTGEILSETDNLKTSNSIITVKFKTIDGFVPEQFYIQKVLAYDGDATAAIADNIITFYYLPNEVSKPEALYNVEYYKFNHLTGTYDQVQSEPGRAIVGDSVSVAVATNKFSGFAYTKAEILAYTSESSYTTVNRDNNTTTLSANLTKYGVVFRIYYDPVKYPYLIKFVEQGNPSHVLGYGKLGSGTVYSSLADVRNEKATFESKQSYTAPSQITVDGIKYDIQTGTSQTQTLTVRIEDNTNDAEQCKVNILTFYYTREVIPVEYHVVCTVPGLVGGQLSQSFEPDPANPVGCIAYVKSGFVFLGWYYDEECTAKVPDSWITDGTQILPPASAIQKGPDGKEHYYALFEPILTDLTINLSGMTGNDSAIFNIKGEGVDLQVAITGNGSVTIQGIYVSCTYEITELTGWSWEYADGGVKTVKAVEGTNEVSFTLESSGSDWLNGETSADNIFN